MPLRRGAAALLAVGTLSALLAGFAARPASTAITGVTVIDTRSGESRAGVTVLLTGDRIAAVGRDEEVRVPRGARVVDGRGKYLIPGLWDMHVHLSYLEPATLALFPANGVLAVREMGGEVEELLRYRGDVREGRLIGPRVYLPGPVVESPGWLAMLRERGGDLPGAAAILRQRMGVATQEEAREAVDSAAALDADFVKLRNNASRDAFFALARAARGRGLPLAGHAPRYVSPAEASDSGQSSFEHSFLPSLDGMTPESRAALFRRFRENGTAVTPTLIAGRNHRLLPDSVVLAALADSLGTRDPRMRHLPRALLTKWREEWELTRRDRPYDWEALHRSSLRDVAEMRAAGTPILAGTDVGVQLVLPGWGLHEELELLVTLAGLTPLEALRSATAAPAAFFGLQDRMGGVAEGMAADLVLLDADPRLDIRNTRRIRAVVAGGTLLDRAALDRLLTPPDRRSH